MQHNAEEQGRGRWKSILKTFGLTTQQLSGNTCSCPICINGEFVFHDDKGAGNYACSGCGKGNALQLIGNTGGGLIWAHNEVIELLTKLGKLRREPIDDKKLISTDPTQRIHDLMDLDQKLMKIEADRPIIVHYYTVEETRKHCQNQLMWVWNNQIAQFMSETDGEPRNKDYAHAFNKLSILHPYMLGNDRLREIAISDRDHCLSRLDFEGQIMYAGKAMRTSELYVHEFHDYLKQMQVFWNHTLPFPLESKNQWYDKAMGANKEQQKQAA